MTSFGLHTADQMSRPPSLAKPPPFSSIALAIFAAVAALIAAYVWLAIMKVPLERPVGPLFDNGRMPREGWAPWYVAPPAAFALTVVMFRIYFRKPYRWTVLGLALAGAIAIVLGGTVPFWVKNIGYTWYSVPGANTTAIASALVPMLALAFVRGAFALIDSAPLCIPAGGLLGMAVALLLDLPWWREPSVAPVGPAGAKPVYCQPIAGPFGRFVTTALMTLFVTTAAAAGMPPGAVAVAPFVALTWWLLSFRGGRYDFANALLGSALLGLISTLPFFLAIATSLGPFGPTISERGFDPNTLLRGFVTRAPVFLLVSVVVIKITLAMTRMARAALARIRTAGAT